MVAPAVVRTLNLAELLNRINRERTDHEPLPPLAPNRPHSALVALIAVGSLLMGCAFWVLVLMITFTRIL